ncbi:heat shock 70 kDa protein 12A-like [Crassostrea virginica]
MSLNPPDCKDLRVVAALDIGTTHSGIAWSSSSEFEKNPLRITSLQWPTSGGSSQTANKTPSVLLLKSNGEFLAFGYDADEKYSELANDNAQYGYYFFKHFKMLLYGSKELQSDMILCDIEGRTLKASDVFVHIIKYMKDRLLGDFKDRGNTQREENIKWVITVPAIWGDAAKQFMRDAAIKAGISKQRLQLALESEAAAIYTKEVLLQRSVCTKEDEEGHTIRCQEGTKFIVTDLGGGTIDTSLKEVCKSNQIRDFHQAVGRPSGGQTVNGEFMAFLEALLGKEVLDELKTIHKGSWLELEREIELKKKNAKGDRDRRILLQIPADLVDIFESKNGKKLTNAAVFESQYAGKVDVKGKKLRVDKDVVESFFRKCLENTINHIENILEKPAAIGSEYIILVGGLAESEFMKTEIRKRFETLPMTVLVPDEPWLAVIRGAVMFGHRPSVVQSRIAQFTYGISVIRYFLDGDDPQHKTIQNGVPFCINVFERLAKVGQSYQVGETVTTEVYAHREGMSEMRIKLYKSPEKEPRYVTDESCTPIGQLVVNMPGYGTQRKVTVSLCFGEEEITCKGENELQEMVEVQLRLLSNN